MIRRIITAALAAAAAVVALAGTAQASGLPNQGGLTPAEKITTVTTQQLAAGHGTWARTVTFKRDALITGGAFVSKAFCPGSDEYCYIFEAKLTDTGTFRTVARAFAPNQFRAGTRISRAMNGTFKGTADVIFYATSQFPRVSSVPGTVSIGLDTANWYKRFFGAGTRYGISKGLQMTTTYRACGQKWVQNPAGGQSRSAGNITC